MKIRKSANANAVKDVLLKLHQVQRELEIIQSSSYEDIDVKLSDDELLKVAKCLLFIWNSRKIFVDESLIADPGWMILLNLKIAELSFSKVQVSTVCIDSGSPPTTGLRWIKLLESKSLIRTEQDTHDLRRKYVKLTDGGSELMSKYLQNARGFISTGGVTF